MKQYKGEWLDLGPSQQDGSAMRYNYVKVNDEVINNLRVMPHLDGVLRDQVRRNFSGEITLWVAPILFKKNLVGVTQADGQVFRQGLGAPYALLVVALLFILFSFGTSDTAFKTPLLVIGGLIALFAISIIRKVWKVKGGQSA